MTLLSWIGLLAICYAVFRAVMLWADGIEHRAWVRDVMSGRALAPWDEEQPEVRHPDHARGADVRR